MTIKHYVSKIFQQTENVDKDNKINETAFINIPADIKPTLTNYKIEIIFWGVRHLKKVNYAQINKPRISIYIGDTVLQSDTLVNAKKHANFVNYYQFTEIVFI